MKARVATSIVLAFGLALGMSGCTLVTNQDTVGMQESSYGVSGSVGSIDVRDAVIIATANGHRGNLVVTFINNDDKAHYLEVQHGSTNKFVAVPALGVKKVGAQGGTRVEFNDLGAKPGTLTNVYFTYAGASGLQLRVPVLATSFPGFQNYAP